ncbi:MAG: BolA family protein [Cypionkella sp.]|nr:BolA family protein [Cypionkella sp.]
MQIEQEIAARLTAAFAPSALRIENQSSRHAGHAGDDGSGESHFAIHIRAPQLAPMSRLARHRAVNAALGDLTTRIHAIAIDAA